MAKAKATDIYMNWFGIEVTASADASDIATESANTAAGAALKQAWRIHVIEWFPTTGFATTNALTLALSTRKNLTVMPGINDKGLIAMMKVGHDESAAGMDTILMPKTELYLPPMVIASPTMNLYAQTTVNDAEQNDKVHQIRVGFTMVELDGAVYSELFGTWNFAD